jgi:5-formyltetrahydrofolate cyclo-ligase
MNTKDKDIRLTKRQLRSKILLKLKNQKEEDRKQKSQIIKERLFRQSVFKKAKRVMFYIALRDEVKTQDMIKAAENIGKIIAVPVCQKNRVSLRPALLDQGAKLRKGPYGVYEPAQKKFMRLKNLDLVVVPGVAFDKKGNRLGRGKGYYDSFLSKIPKKTTSIGLAFNLQILPTIPLTTHDVSVKKVLFA